jgi:hypothetical protein
MPRAAAVSDAASRASVYHRESFGERFPFVVIVPSLGELRAPAHAGPR